MNRKVFNLILAVVAGLLLALSWPARGLAPLIFMAFIPLLYISDECVKFKWSPLKAFPYLYLAFVLWNLLTTYWIVYASTEGAMAAIFVNSWFMSLVWMLFIRVKKTFGNFRGYLALVLFWIAYEYLHLDWDLSWPWLMIGNVFANNPMLIQWYDITGSMGGTLWVLLVNIFLYETFKEYKHKKIYTRSAIVTASLILLPILFSVLRYGGYREKNDPVNIVCVQPNIDPWGKFGGIPAGVQLNQLIELSLPHFNENTDYLIFPETAIPISIDEEHLEKDFAIDTLQKVIAGYPKLKLITGVSLYKYFQTGDVIPSTASEIKGQPGVYWDDYNAAIQIGNGDPYQVYYKSKLVPGPEMFPFADVLKPFQKQLFGKLGGMIGDFGTQKERSVFVNEDRKVNAAPVICYESIYGEYCTDYVKNGANFISISTNDAWWGDRPGYKQLLAYARLRAIETRRSIARAANTGISCFINQRGDVISPTKYNTDAVVAGTINANDELTFYVKHGDYLGRISLWLGLVLLVITYIFATFFRKKKA
jgi:apolipoprotein N-acyltransferase